MHINDLPWHKQGKFCSRHTTYTITPFVPGPGHSKYCPFSVCILYHIFLNHYLFLGVDLKFI